MRPALSDTGRPCRHDHSDRVRMMVLRGRDKHPEVLEVCISCPREHRYHKVADLADRPGGDAEPEYWAWGVTPGMTWPEGAGFEHPLRTLSRTEPVPELWGDLAR
jgi:hypothetical protein